jgi:hypothetical protein
MKQFLIAMVMSVCTGRGQIAQLDSLAKSFLIKKLDSIQEEDQKYRLKLDRYENNRKKTAELWHTIHLKDSLNLIKVEAILNQYGWLGSDDIGEKGNGTIFLVIQHAGKAAQEKYLPLMRSAVRNGKALPSDLALLEDRVALKQGKKQIYGSQVFTDPETGESQVFPLLDPDNVNNRRKEVGLQPIEEYLKHFNMKWDVGKYKANLPELENKTLGVWKD